MVEQGGGASKGPKQRCEVVQVRSLPGYACNVGHSLGTQRLSVHHHQAWPQPCTAGGCSLTPAAPM
jgi:hypothetical protein